MTAAGGDTAKIDGGLADAVRGLLGAVLRHTVVLARARGVSATDLRALELVHRGAVLRPGELARALGMSPGGTTGVIGRIVGAALLYRDAGPANHHDVRLRATEAGAGMLPLAPGRQVRVACEQLNLGQAERAEITNFLLTLAGLVEHETEATRLAASRSRPIPSPPRWA